MALPESRDITLNPGDPVPSALLNKLQDQIIGQKKPSHWRYQVPGKGFVETNIVHENVGGLGTGEIHASANGAFFTAPCLIPLQPGDRVTGIAARISGPGGVQNVAIDLARASFGDSIGSAGLLTVVDPAAAWATYENVAIVPYVVGSSGVIEAFYWRLTIPLLNTKIQTLGVRIDRL